MTPAEKRAFIFDNTAISAPPHVPEIRLHLADEAHDLWHRTEEELQQIGLPPPFWAFAWAGGQGLARYVLDHPEIVKGCTVFDFATGSGIVAIAAAKAGAASVAACDVDPFCGPAVALNAAMNGASIRFDEDDPVGKPLSADILLAGDVFFDRQMTERIVPWFADLSARGTGIIVGDPGRSYLPREHLALLAEYRVPVTRALEDAEIKKTCVWRFA